jgi:hypothetical protein
MQSVVDLINRTIMQVERAAQYNKGRESISHPPPDTNDPIHVPKIRGNSAPLVLLSAGNEQPNSPPEAESDPVPRLVRVSGGIPAAMPVSDNRNSLGKVREIELRFHKIFHRAVRIYRCRLRRTRGRSESSAASRCHGGRSHHRSSDCEIIPMPPAAIGSHRLS